MEEKFLEGNFEILPHYQKCKLTLTRQNIIIQENINTDRSNFNRLTSILFSNVIGSKICTSKLKEDSCFYLQLVALVRNKKKVRERLIYSFRIKDSPCNEDNYKVALRWAKLISWLIREPEISRAQLQEKKDFPKRRKFFIMINPCSGKGRSKQLYEEEIEPVLKDANIDVDVFVTEYAGHCKEIAKTLDYKRYDAVVICSGDGLVNEYINGILLRDDSKEAIKHPIGVLPTGSGNALSASILFTAKEEALLINSIYILVKGKPHPLDLFSITMSNNSLFGFLSVTWGYLADVDIESEKYRKLGAIRFQIGAIERIVKLRHYHGKFMYVPFKPSDTTQLLGSMDENGIKNVSVIGNVCGERNFENNDNSHINQGNSINGPSINGESINTNKSFSKEWITLEDDFVSVFLCGTTHLGVGMYSSPFSNFNDGHLKAFFVRKGITKKRMLQLVLKFEDGTYIDYPEVQCVDVKEFRILPDLSTPGHLVIDGENIEYAPIDGVVHPSLANVIVLFP